MKKLFPFLSLMLLALMAPLLSEEPSDETVIAIVLSVEGDVRIELTSPPSVGWAAPTENWKMAQEGDAVLRGERLRTLQNGTVRLVVKPNENWDAVRIGPNRLWQYQDDVSAIKTAKSFLVGSRNAATFRAVAEAGDTTASCVLGPVLPEFSALAGEGFTADWSNLAASPGPYRVLVKNESGQTVFDHVTTEQNAWIEFPEDNTAQYSWNVRINEGHSLHTGQILVRGAGAAKDILNEFNAQSVSGDAPDDVRTIIQAMLLIEHKLYLQTIELLLSARPAGTAVDGQSSKAFYDNWIGRTYQKMCQANTN